MTTTPRGRTTLGLYQLRSLHRATKGIYIEEQSSSVTVDFTLFMTTILNRTLNITTQIDRTIAITTVIDRTGKITTQIDRILNITTELNMELG